MSKKFFKVFCQITADPQIEQIWLTAEPFISQLVLTFTWRGLTFRWMYLIVWVTFVVVTTQSQHLEIVTVKKKNTVPEAVPVNADIEDDERRVPGHKGTILVLWEDVEISIKFQFMQIEESWSKLKPTEILRLYKMFLARSLCLQRAAAATDCQKF